jgi:hypothetical protein
MLYGTYESLGYLIGSGAIESAHRNVFDKRLKLWGQGWTKKGLQQVANLSVGYKNQQWNKVEKLIKNAA